MKQYENVAQKLTINPMFETKLHVLIRVEFAFRFDNLTRCLNTLLLMLFLLNFERKVS